MFGLYKIYHLYDTYILEGTNLLITLNNNDIYIFKKKKKMYIAFNLYYLLDATCVG